MAEFLYLYRGGETPKSPAEGQEVMQKWMAWMKELGAAGHLKAVGSPLEKTGKLVSGTKKVVSDGPFAEAKDVIGGYTLVTAKDIDEAVEVSKGCPIFSANGAVEVRPILQMNM
ncbi:MAG: YciI family protein [Acidobacteriota bacterium]|nr:YciI family protein [Acidobacteriota bacterium]